MTHSQIVSFLWGVADLTRDSFKRGKYQDVMGPFDFEKLLLDYQNLAANLRRYIQGFSPNMGEVIEKFDFDNTISKGM